MSLLSPQLQAFMAIVKHRTVHAAAKSIFLTQTAVTQRIRGLEKKLDTTLFIRTRRGMNLTAEGEALLRYCQAAKNLETDTLSNIHGDASTVETRLAISAPSSIMRSRVIPACAKLTKQYPRLLLELDMNDAGTQQQLLKAGQCDLAILEKQDIAPEMKSKPLHPEQYILVCSSAWQDHTLADILSNEYIIDFNVSDHMTLNYLQAFNLSESVKSSRHFVNRTDAIAKLICDGVGYSTLTKEFAKPFIDSGEMIVLNDNKIYNHKPYLAWYHRPEMPDYFANFIKAIV